MYLSKIITKITKIRQSDICPLKILFALDAPFKKSFPLTVILSKNKNMYIANMLKKNVVEA